VHSVAEGKLKYENREKKTGLGGGGRKGKGSVVPSWMSSSGSWVSSKVSTWTPSSIGSTLGR